MKYVTFQFLVTISCVSLATFKKSNKEACLYKSDYNIAIQLVSQSVPTLCSEDMEGGQW